MPGGNASDKPKGPFPLFLADFLGGTKGWRADEQIAYLKALVHLWEQGGQMPGDDASLVEILGRPPHRARARILSKVKAKLVPLSAIVTAIAGNTIPQLPLEQSTMVGHPKIARLLAKRMEIKIDRAAAGRAGGLAKARKSAGKSQKQSLASITSKNSTNLCTSPTTITDDPDGGEKSYAVDLKIVRLTAKDLARWVKQFPTLNVERELEGIDAWLVLNPPPKGRWFWMAHRMLQKRAAATEAVTPHAELEQALEERDTPMGKILVDRRDGSRYIRSPSGKLIPQSGGGI